MLLAILLMKKLDSDLGSDVWQGLNLWGSKVHCHAATLPPTWSTSRISQKPQ